MNPRDAGSRATSRRACVCDFAHKLQERKKNTILKQYHDNNGVSLHETCRARMWPAKLSKVDIKKPSTASILIITPNQVRPQQSRPDKSLSLRLLQACHRELATVASDALVCNRRAKVCCGPTSHIQLTQKLQSLWVSIRAV